MAAEREMTDVSRTECPVCCEPFRVGATVFLVACGGNHLVRGECVDKVMTRDEEPTCPVCQRSADVTTVCEGCVCHPPGMGMDTDPIVVD